MHVTCFLESRGLSLATLERSWFYSDSVSDLPLLGAVSDPVAVSPDARLRALALRSGWPVLERD
jgi:phosphoserine phosphatase